MVKQWLHQKSVAHVIEMNSRNNLFLMVAMLAVALAIACNGGGNAPRTPVALFTTPRSDASGVSSRSPLTGSAPTPVPAQVAGTSKHRMNDARQAHAAVLLEDGKLLAIGGAGPYGPMPLVEIYDPATDIWTTLPRMSQSRSFHTATVLKDGKILVVGGVGESEHLRSAEIFDPATRQWTQARRMKEGRGLHTAALLEDGRVLVAGGVSDNGPLASAEIYDPESGNWSPTGSMTEARTAHAMAILPDGRVLVSGGGKGGLDLGPGTAGLFSAEIYDPSTGVWSPTGDMQTARIAHKLTVLLDGRVLATGGDEVGTTNEIYDPATGTWKLVAEAEAIRQDHTATLLPDGRVLVTGGGPPREAEEDSAEIYDPTTDLWTPAGNMDLGRVSHSATLLKDGRVMIVGGANDSGPFNSVEFYDPISGNWTSEPFMGKWTRVEDMAETRAEHSATLLGNGQVLVVGGRAREPRDELGQIGLMFFRETAELYDPVTQQWSKAASMSEARGGHTATLLGDGRVLVAGGRAVGEDAEGKRQVVYRSSVEIFDPTTNSWSQGESMTEPRWGHTATTLTDGRILVAGGENDSGRLKTTEIFDPSTGTWSRTGDLVEERAGHSAFLRGDGSVLVVGGAGYVVETYDPNTGTWTMERSLPQPVSNPEAALLYDGKVVVTGGFGPQGPVPVTQVYDPSTKTWTLHDNIPDTRVGHQFTLLKSGRVLLTGGGKTTKAYLYDSEYKGWLLAGKMVDTRRDHTATVLDDGTVLVVGGEERNNNILRSVELYTQAKPE